MNALKPSMAAALIAAIALIVFFVLKSPPEAPPEDRDPPRNTLNHQNSLKKAGLETDRQIRAILKEPNADYRRTLLGG